MNSVPEAPAPRASAVLLANGPLSQAAVPRLRAQAAAARWLVGVDGGAAGLLALGLVPHIVTGDFDSLGVETRETLSRAGARIVPTPDQNYTDLDKAIDYSIQTLGARDFAVFGATGGRLDHTYSVLSALIKHGRAASIRLIDEFGETSLVHRAFVRTGPDLPGRILSLLALGRVEGVTTTGVRWPLHGETLAPGVRDGTLNEITDETITVEVASGDLLIMLHHAR